MGPFAFALLLGQSPGVDLQVPVTFEHRAAPLSRVLAKLSETTKIKFETVPAVAGEVVLISVKDVPVGDLLQKIASVTTSEWKQDGDVYRLTPAAGLRNREATEEFNLKLTALRTSLSEQIKTTLPKAKTSKTATATANSAGEEAVFETQMGPFGGGSDGALLKIVQGVDLRAIAALRPNERVVFSTQPTRMQRPLPGTVGTLVASMVAEHNERVKKNGANPDMDEMPPGVEIPKFVRDMMDRQSKPIGAVNKALLVASRMGMGGYEATNLELRLYDANGKVVHSVPGSLQSNTGAIMRAVERMQGKKPESGPKTPIELSPESKLFQEAMAKGIGTTGMTLKPEVKALLYRPDLHDPLSFMASDTLLALAKKRGKPIVASVPDSMVSVLDGRATQSVEDIEEDLQSGGVIRAVADPTFLLLKPAKPAETRLDRLDRTALTALMQAVDKKTIPTLDDVAAYATKAPSPMEGGLGQVYVMMFVPGAFAQSMSGFTNWDALRFYGMLGPDARRRLAGGGRIPYAMLTQAQSALVGRMVFGVMANLTVEDPNKKPEENGMMSMLMMFGMGMSGGDFRTEPTEVMPNGLPGDGYVSANVVSDFFASPVMEGDEATAGPLSVLGAEELAIFKMLSEDKNYAQMAGFMPKIDRVKVGERTVWNFAFHVAPQTAMRTLLNDNRMPQNAKTFAMSDIPPAFQKRIAAKLEDVKKSPLGAIGGMMGAGGGVATPPPN